MCGRFELHSPYERIVEAFRVKGGAGEVAPRYNIAPSQDVLIVSSDGGGNRLRSARWGLIPAWADDPAIGHSMINARGETLTEKKSFRGLLKDHRCIVAADGFYEWKKEGRQKVPLYITLRDRPPFGFAGLYSVWKARGGEEILTCTIITTAANDVIGAIHDRMPVILAKNDEETWLEDGELNQKALDSILTPYPGSEIEMYEVTPLVNSPSNDSPMNIRKAG